MKRTITAAQVEGLVAKGVDVDALTDKEIARIVALDEKLQPAAPKKVDAYKEAKKAIRKANQEHTLTGKALNLFGKAKTKVKAKIDEYLEEDEISVDREF